MSCITAGVSALTSTTGKLAGDKAFCRGSTCNARQQGGYSQLLPGGSGSASLNTRLLHHLIQCLKDVESKGATECFMKRTMAEMWWSSAMIICRSHTSPQNKTSLPVYLIPVTNTVKTTLLKEQDDLHANQNGANCHILFY
jgi:hypothetical protein